MRAVHNFRSSIASVLTALAVFILFSFTGCAFIDQITETPDAAVSPSEPTARSEASSDRIPAGFDPDFHSSDAGYYFYDRLDFDEKQVYDSLMQGVCSQSSAIMINSPIGKRISDIYTMLCCDHPEIFWLDSAYSYEHNDTLIKFKPSYIFSDIEERDEMNERIKKETDSILEKIGSHNSEYEIAKAVFEFVIDDVEYAVDCENSQNLISSMIGKQSVCAGYAKETQYLLQKLGIPAVYVSGETPDSGKHAWIKARIGDKFYNIDTTFGDAEYHSENGTAEQKLMPYGYAYLCFSDRLFDGKRTSTGLCVPYPECSDDSLNYFRLGGCCFETMNDDVLQSMDNSISAGQKIWYAQICDIEGYKELLSLLGNGEYMNKVFLFYNSLKSIRVSMSYDGEAQVVYCGYEITG